MIWGESKYEIIRIRGHVGMTLGGSLGIMYYRLWIWFSSGLGLVGVVNLGMVGCGVGVMWGWPGSLGAHHPSPVNNQGWNQLHTCPGPMAAASSHEYPGGRPVPPGPGNWVLRWIHIGQDGAGYYERAWHPIPGGQAPGPGDEMEDEQETDSDLPRSVSDSDESESGHPVMDLQQVVV